MTATLFLPLASIQIENAFCQFDATGIASAKELIYPTWGLFALVAVIALIALITIFLFKKRILQIRLCVFNAILMVCFYALWGYIYGTHRKYQEKVFLSIAK